MKVERIIIENTEDEKLNDYLYFDLDGNEVEPTEDMIIVKDETLRFCAGCETTFTVDSEDFRATPDLDPELIYCDVCNEEARQWCEEVESRIYPK